MRNYRVEEVPVNDLARMLDQNYREGRHLIQLVDGETTRKHCVLVVTCVDTPDAPPDVPPAVAPAESPAPTPTSAKPKRKRR